MEFIDVLDITNNRKSSLAMNEKKAIPNTLRVMGNLPHNTTITFSRQGAEQMIAFCQGILNSYPQKKETE